MADAKISALSDGTTPAGSDVFPIARAGANNSLTWTEMLTAVKAVTLDLFAAPAANVAMNAKKLTGLAAGTTTGDALRYEQLFTAGAVPIADIADPTTGMVIGSASSAAAAVFPPGYEIGYDQITANVTVASTTEASGTTIISCAAHTFDGSPVLAHFYAPCVISNTTADQETFFSLFESSTQKGRIAAVLAPHSTTAAPIAVPVSAFFRFTPTAASHTYTVTAHNSAGTTGVVAAGTPGTGAFAPAFIRFTKI